MDNHKILLKNCKIYDGITPPYKGEILINGDKIEEVAQQISVTADNFIDLNGLSISPGFIDAHSHNDWFAIKNDPINYFEPFLRQGITSFVTGNCGLSSTGFDSNSNYIDKMGAGLFFFHDTIGIYSKVNDFFDAIDNNSPLNIATLVGHCTARSSVNGYNSAQLDSSQMKEMLDILESSLINGACGISLGLMYEPGLYANTAELKEIVKLCEKYDKPLTVHARACSAVSLAYANPFGRPHLLRALDELVEITKGTKVKLQYSHAIFVGENSFKCADELLSIIDGMRSDGVDCMFDIYSELCGVSVITVIMPVWYQALSKKDKQKASNKLMFKAHASVAKKLLGFQFSDMIIAYLGEEGSEFEGMNVEEVAQKLGMSQLDTYLYLCELSNYKGRVNIYKYSSPEILSKLSKHPQSLYMTDAWIEDKGAQNIAVYDCFPKFLHLSLNGEGDSFENTIAKMTSRVAKRFSIPQRGEIKKGYFADLTVFSEDELMHTKPDQFKSFGIKYVFVNGKLVMENEQVNYDLFKYAGKAIKV